ncbi:GntR family transcriptional regulator [Bacillus sp. V3-13]|uniref:GntR family transcriptional regulator n=1 Tax=Bacillus sp. V3-13 TaxID=2053728 RepID=UPI000C793A8B|nr:GntR family transcriptional regulator [Bacillus sp. V3-13]PLR75871.1 GntR family transcriptional regulator [Bacillus sp. V3-13]
MNNLTIKNQNSKKKKTTAADRAYSAIRIAIANGELRPGYPLLETELSEQLGMSRTPVREALNRLKAEDIIETVKRKGIFVKTLSKEELFQWYEVAEGLEGMVAYLVASDPNVQLGELENDIKTMEEALTENNTDKWIVADEHYHAALNALCKNVFLVENLQRVHEKLRLARLVLIAGSTPDKTQSTREHRANLEAIKAGDAELARQITQNHWKRIRKAYQGLSD